jgi:hypothetical protein
MKGWLGSSVKVLLALGVAVGAAWAVAAADVDLPPFLQSAAGVASGADSDAPRPWLLVLAGFGVIGWAAVRRLGQR